MLEFFQYDYVATFDKERSHRISAVFVPFRLEDPSLLSSHLKAHFERHVPPDKIILLGTSERREEFTSFLNDADFFDRLPSITRMSDAPQILAVCRQESGTFDCFSATGKIDLSDFIRNDLRQEGLMRIFRDRQGVLEGNGRVHYVKPSGDHSDKFVRAANVLIRGSETALVAFWLLEYLRDDIRHIYTDTAAINLLAYTLVSLKQQTNPSFPTPTIDSYSSYEGRHRFPYQDLDKSLFLTSASTSGRLEKTFFKTEGEPQGSGVKYIQSETKQAKFVTLFYLGHPPDGQSILLDVTKSESNPAGYERIVNHPPNECLLCAQNIPAVQITGDQFLPQDPISTHHLITKEDEPKWLAAVCRDLVGRQVVCCFVPAEGVKRRDLILDLKGEFGLTGLKSEFRDELDRLLIQSIPANLGQIVYLDDPASAALAEKILEALKSFGLPEPMLPQLVPDRELTAMLNKGSRLNGASMVVAAVSAGGRRLLQVSQALRELQKVHALFYLIGILRPDSSLTSTVFQSSLSYGPTGGKSYDMRIIREIFLPDEAPPYISSWESEDILLERLDNWMAELSEEHEQYELIEAASNRLNERRESLRDANAGTGLVDNLFWKNTASSNELELRGTFAFWPKALSKQGAARSQADVYFTMTSVCHNIRQRLKLDQLSQQHQRTALNPMNFERFNDGVVQASLLRAARPAELDYSSDLRGSTMMRAVLEYLFSNFTNQGGEGCFEFLIALASRRLCLTKSDTLSVLNVVEDHCGGEPLSLIICSYLREKTKL